MIELERDEEVLILRLAHGKVNALDLELLRALPDALAQAMAEEVRAVVLTGAGPAFSAGVDLPRLLEGGDEYVDEFMPALDRAFESLFFFPKPVVAAVNGHAIAGGCVLVQCCDLRIGSRGNALIGVPELKVGVPFPLLALEIMRFAVRNDRLQEVVFQGANYKSEEALERGLYDRLVDDEAEIMDEALRSAKRLGALPMEAFEFNKELLRRSVQDTLRKHGEHESERVRAIWKSDEVRASIERFVQATLRR